MMGLDTADRMCYEQAKAMGLAPNYRAFVSSNRQDLVHVVYPGFRETLPVTNLRVGLLLSSCINNFLYSILYVYFSKHYLQAYMA